MSSPTRNPKDLKTIVNGTKSLDEETLATNFEKLNKLSHDDRNEIAMLRSRIDEQSKLICILKQRADEYIIKNQWHYKSQYHKRNVPDYEGSRNQNTTITRFKNFRITESRTRETLERMNSDYRCLNDQTEDRYCEERKRADLIDMRFSELAANHEEMIKFKDQHKARNRQLIKENQKLKEDNKNLFSAAIQQRDEMIQLQNQEMNSLKDKLQTLMSLKEQNEKEIRDCKHGTSQKISMLTNQLSKSQTALTDAEQQILNLKRKLSDAENHKIAGSEKLKQEKEELVQQVMQRGKLLQERQAQIDKLEEEVASSRKEVEDAKSKFMIMEARVNANTRVKALQAAVDEANQSLYRSKMEFEAFRVHSNNLLSREKELNNKLRHNIS